MDIKFKPLKWLTDKFEQFQVWMDNTYCSFLDLALNHRKTIVLTSLAAVMFSCGVIAPQIPGEFITTPERNDFQANFEFPAGTTLETADASIRQFEAKLDTDPNVESHLTIVGLQESAWGKAER